MYSRKKICSNNFEKKKKIEAFGQDFGNKSKKINLLL